MLRMLFRLAKLQISLETEPHLALFCKNVFSGIYSAPLLFGRPVASKL